MKPAKVTQKDFLFLTISFFVIVVMWIAFNIYHAAVTSTISEDLQMQLTPIAGTFDTTTLEALQSRKKVDPLFTSTIIEGPGAAEVASEEAELVPEETITPSPLPDESPTPSITITIEEETTTPTITP
ncbi:MAG TPA: hypothetical protein VLF20_04460 [Patescibacteria group bacterium]|nr:hypothetical protein [Patescibacteria group bacterium]